jgi:hypothetical protein
MSFVAAARRSSPLRWFLPLVAGVPLLAGCESDADTVCTDIANCSHGGSDDYLTACRDENADLSHEATRSSCSAEYDAYFSCANKQFECRGNESVFPGCDAKLGALDACLAAGRADNACGELTAKLAACPSGAPAPNGSDGGASLDPCTAAGVCSARCYLDSLADVCAPTAAELASFSDCTSHCVP